MKPPTGVLNAVWYWWIKMDPPVAEAFSRTVPGIKWARLVPMALTGFHRSYADRHGLHWGPCVLCMRPYGGHQSAGGVPDPTMPPADPERGPWHYVGICPACTRAGKGDQR